MVRPKKYLGQHFLTDHKIAASIVQHLEARDVSTILEVGPGKGILTRYLMERQNVNLCLVEIDTEAVRYLKEEWPELETSIREEDFLKFDFSMEGEKIAVIGNFPYNISSQIFFHILDFRDNVPEIVCMLQKEVALRLASGPGSRDYGILSVLLQSWYDIKVLFHVKPGSFFPPPKVNSSVLKLVRNERQKMDCDENLFKRLVKTSFNQRRKMIRNSISSMLNGKIIDMPYASMRPEQLSPDDFIRLSIFLQEELTKQKIQ